MADIGRDPASLGAREQAVAPREPRPPFPSWAVPPLPTKGTIGLVGCVKRKLTHSAPAHLLYTSAMFKREHEWASVRCDRWFILSAKHGLVAPEAVLAPYEETLNKRSKAEKEIWSADVLDQLVTVLATLRGRHFEIYAGRNYFGFGLSAGLIERGATVSIPWSGLGLGQRAARTEYMDHG